MANSIANIGKLPELRKRLLFMVAMLGVYRLGVFVSIPGTNRLALAGQFDDGLLGMFNMFTGGALEQSSIFSLGIMPYITSSIIIQLLTVAVPKLEELKKEGEQGQKKITQYTRYGTVALAAIQGFFMVSQLEVYGRGQGVDEVVANPGWSFKLMGVLTLTTGTCFLMWLGEQITERGIGNGISLIIFAGIVAAMPAGLTELFTVQKPSNFMLLMMVLACVGTVAAVCYFERAHRRIPIQYTRRNVGRKVMQPAQSHLPLKINISGVIPPIFASAILMFPLQIASMTESTLMQQFASILQPTDWRYNVIYVALVIFFAFFYTAITFNPVDVADNLKKSGGFIPGIRPGKKTADYIDYVVTRITTAGAVYLSVVCLTPAILNSKLNLNYSLGNIFAGTGLLIVVGVALDTVEQINSFLIQRDYEGLTGPKGPRIRGRRTSGRK